MKRKIRACLVTLTLAVVMTVCPAVTLSAHSFIDVRQYDDAITMLNELGVIKGYSETSFKPDENVSRWQMALMMSKLVTANVDTAYWQGEGTSGEFTDVKSWSVYPTAIEYANKNGIVRGRGNGIFDPSADISLQEGLTMAVRALGYPSGDYDGGYPDSYIIKGRELGLLNGLTSANYTAAMTRGQTAQLLYNALYATRHSGKTLAVDVFKFTEGKIVLAATDTMRINNTVGYAEADEFKFCELSSYGGLSNPFALDRSVLKGVVEYEDPNDILGMAFNISARNEYETIISITRCSQEISSVSGLKVVDSNNNKIALGNVVYTTVSTYTRPLVDMTPPAEKQLIVYAVNDTKVNDTFSFVSGNVVNAARMDGSCAYYEMKAYDDNGDGFADRALYRPYSFGRYEVSEETGKIKIAGNNKLEDIKIEKLGYAPLSSGEYVLYSFDSQTKTLVIYKQFTVTSGTVASYTSGTGEVSISVGNTAKATTYTIGNDDLPGAHTDDLIDVFNTGKSIVAYPIEFIADGTTLLYAAMGDIGQTTGGTYYYSNLQVVTSIPAMTTIGKLNVSLDGGSFVYSVSALDGSTSYSTIATLRVGDVVETVYDARTSSVSLTRRNSAPTYSTVTSSAKLGVDGIHFKVTENGFPQMAVPVDSNTRIVMMDGTGATPIVYSADKFTGSYDMDGFRSVYVSYGTVNNGFAQLIYVRPFDATTLKVDSASFTAVVYINQTQIYDGGLTPSSSSGYSYYYSYAGFDIATGGAVTVQMSAPNTKLTTAGYYPVLNNYILGTSPVTSSTVGATYTLYLGQRVTSAALGTLNMYYSYTIGGYTYNVPTESLKIFSKSYDPLSGYTITNVTSEVSLTQLEGRTVDIMFYNSSYTSSSYYGPLYIILS